MPKKPVRQEDLDMQEKVAAELAHLLKLSGGKCSAITLRKALAGILAVFGKRVVAK